MQSVHVRTSTQPLSKSETSKLELQGGFSSAGILSSEGFGASLRSKVALSIARMTKAHDRIRREILALRQVKEKTSLTS
jgi:hypothetical protein